MIINCPVNNLSYGIVSQNILDNLSDYILKPIGPFDQEEYSRYLPKVINYFDNLDLNQPSLKIFHENQLFDHVGKGTRIGFPIFERNIFTPEHIFNLKHQDIVLVCSNWAKQIVEPINPNVIVCPLGVDSDFTPGYVPNKEDKVIFYTQGKREIRKGHDYLHKVFHKAFSEYNDVELWMFTYNHFDTPVTTREFQTDYKKLLGNKVKFFPWLSKKEMINWLHKTDCGIFLSRAEGWCFCENTEILTDVGFLKIKDVKIGNKVINHIGGLETVEKVLVKENKDSMVEIKPVGSQIVRLTRDHPVFCFQNPYKTRITFIRNFNKIKPAFIKASEIKKGDFLAFPKVNTLYNKRIKINNTEFVLNKDMMRFFGYYVAEGSGNVGSSTLSFNSNEQFYHNDVIRILKENFACTPNITHYERNRCSIVFSKKWLSKMLHDMFGRRAPNKRVPFEFMFLENYLIKEFLIGLFRGDGTCNGGNRFRLSTTSKLLANQVRVMLIKLGTRPTIKYSIREKCDEYTVEITGKDRHILNFDNITIKNGRPNHQTIDIENYMLMPVKYVKEIEKSNLVYNLQVSGEHTYCINSFAVHNCMPLAESLAMGKEVVATYYSGHTEYLKDGIRPIKMKEAFDSQWFNGGFTWMEIEANEEEIVNSLREKYEVCKQRKTNFDNVNLIKNFTWKNTAEIINGLQRM